MPRRLYSDLHGGRESHIPTAANNNRLTLRNSTCTPLRTPMSGMSRPSHLMTSARKNGPPTEDKKLMQSRTVRILAYAKNIRELSNDFLSKADLKSMSVRDFVILVNHLVKQINSKVSLNSNNYSDELHKFLTQMDYPFSVNKSWFKTPNAPHSLGHIVLMLDFLLDFLPWEQDFQHDYDSLPFTSKGHNFPSVEFTHHFRQKVAEGYQLWNNEDDAGFGALKAELKNDLLRALNVDGFKAQPDLAADCDRLEREIAAFAPVAPFDQRELDQVEQTVLAKSAELGALTEQRKEAIARGERLRAELQGQSEELRALQAEEERVKRIVARQREERIREDFDELSQEFSKVNAALQARQSFIDRLSQAHYNKMLLHTRLVDRRGELQGTLQLKLMELKGQPGMRELLDLDEVSGQESMADLERLKQKLSNFLATGLNTRQEEVASIERQIGELNNLKIAYQNGVLGNLQRKLAELKEEHSQSHTELAEMSVQKRMFQEQMREKEQRMRAQAAEMQRSVEVNRQELVRLDAEKKEIRQRTREEIDEVKQGHKRKAEQFRGTLGELEEAMRRLRNV